MVMPAGTGKSGRKFCAQGQFQIAALGDLDGVFQRLGQVGEQLRHFFRRAQVLLFAVTLGAPRVVQGAAVMNADPRLVGLEIILLQEMHIVGGHHRHAMGRRKRYRPVQVFLLPFPSGTLQLQVETVREQGMPIVQQARGIRLAAGQQGLADITGTAAGQGNEPCRAVRQPGAFDDGYAEVLTLDIATRHQAVEAVVALPVLAQQDQPEGLGGLLLVLDPDVAADDGLHSRRHGGAIELHHGEQVALIGDGAGGHAGLGHGLDQGFDAHDPVHQGIFRVQAQVDEGSRHGGSFRNCPCSCKA
jgi:hypothetical protein